MSIRNIIVGIVAIVVVLGGLAYFLGWFTEEPPELPDVPETMQEGDMPLTPEGEEEPLPDPAETGGTIDDALPEPAEVEEAVDDVLPDQEEIEETIDDMPPDQEETDETTRN